MVQRLSNINLRLRPFIAIILTCSSTALPPSVSWAVEYPTSAGVSNQAALDQDPTARTAHEALAPEPQKLTARFPDTASGGVNAWAPSASSLNAALEALSFRGNPAFTRNSLSSAMLPWYDRIFTAINASVNLVNGRAQGGADGGDAYMEGRFIGDYTASLVMALRATGDLQFLDRIVDVLDYQKLGLRDTWLDGTHGDGFKKFRWLITPSDATYYGKDLNWLDESIYSGNIALLVYTLHMNRDLSPRYAAAEDYWRDHLENHFLAKWYQRAAAKPECAGRDPALCAWNVAFAAFYKPDVNPRSMNWRLAYFLWKTTGNAFYRDRAEEIRIQLLSAQQINPAFPTAYRWSRTLNVSDQDWQPINYANYYMRVIIEMHLEGITGFETASQIARFAATFRDVVYRNSLPNLTSMYATVNGDGTPSTGFGLYMFNGLGRWDPSGFLNDLGNRAFSGSYGSGGNSGTAYGDVQIAGYALMALAPSGSTPDTVAPAGPSNLRATQ